MSLLGLLLWKPNFLFSALTIPFKLLNSQPFLFLSSHIWTCNIDSSYFLRRFMPLL
ncbi:hypothetical protein KP509_28G061000 [Ceratopteris richardii]|uniref:Uncharacterized protein n=1 Tax=Ceratopteris richardii TaxID=49495 RepID=A0A8T2RF97_CERRI|nr:hypothetical protein KP509_28G061000 [Ceratopteris richardii]